MMVGRTKEAIAEYEARARIDDGDARAHSDLGTALLATQDLERALSELQRAVQLDPHARERSTRTSATPCSRPGTWIAPSPSTARRCASTRSS